LVPILLDLGSVTRVLGMYKIDNKGEAKKIVALPGQAFVPEYFFG
jgi:hypothetical protein